MLSSQCVRSFAIPFKKRVLSTIDIWGGNDSDINNLLLWKRCEILLHFNKEDRMEIRVNIEK